MEGGGRGAGARRAARLSRRDAALIAAALLAAYAATLGLDAFGESDYGGDEPHYLLAAQSLVADGDVDVADEYAARAYATFYPIELDAHGERLVGELNEPHGVGFPALIAPAFAAAGAIGVELLMAALAALAGTLGYLLARRVAERRWALLAALAVGLAPPVLAYGTAVYPELAAGAALAGAALLALRLGERPSWPCAIGCAALLAALPWLGTKYVPAGLVIGIFAVRALRRRDRRLLAVAGVQLVGAAALAYVLVNQSIYGGPTPYAADVEGQTATDAASPVGYLARSYRLAALLVDREYGLLRWAPVLALALAGGWLLVRNLGPWRPRGGRAGPRFAAPFPTQTSGSRGPRELDLGARQTAGLCAAVVLAQLAVAAFLAPTMFGFWFPGRHVLAALPLAVPLVALGIARFPRAGAALAAVGVVASTWLYVVVRLDAASLAVGWPDVPWGPLDAVLPYYGESPLPYALTAAAAAVAALGWRVLRARTAARQARQTAGATRRRYSG